MRPNKRTVVPIEGIKERKGSGRRRRFQRRSHQRLKQQHSLKGAKGSKKS